MSEQERKPSPPFFWRILHVLWFILWPMNKLLNIWMSDPDKPKPKLQWDVWRPIISTILRVFGYTVREIPGRECLEFSKQKPSGQR